MKPAERLRLRVAKKLLPGQPGTLKLERKFGDALLCVRYRVDPQTRQRVTTVELIVDQAPLTPRPDRTVGVRVNYRETELRQQMRDIGATWDSQARLWRMPFRAASRLGLHRRIVET